LFTAAEEETISLALACGDHKEMKAFIYSAVGNQKDWKHVEWKSGKMEARYAARTVNVQIPGSKFHSSTIGTAWIMANLPKVRIYGIRFRSQRSPREVASELGVICKSIEPF
jgi:hypothetical protein